ncbi:MAG: cysteine rich repeat-containing protein [Burkholderiales bacterium]
MRRILVAQLWIIFLILGISGAQAEDKETRGACRADVKKLCKDVQPGGGRIATCLKQHEAELSPGCKERIAEAKKERKELADACKADVENLCKGVPHGQGRVLRCLAENKDKLSSACRAEISEVQNRHPCMKDMERLCKGVQPGEGRMKECMKQNEAELSPECKAHRGGKMDGEKK